MEADEQPMEEPVGDGEGDAQVPAEDGAAVQDAAPAQPAAPPPAGMDVLARLANALEAIGGRDRAPTYKAPKFHGLGDVEYFLDQFHEVAEANGWDDAGTLIHL